MTRPGDETASQPAVSVVISCYNLGRYLSDAVDSVLAQTFEDFEIVVVDDGSTDEATRRLLTGYRKPKTHVLRTVNVGLPAAKNLGLRHTTGRYVCMLDADDRLDPALLEKSVRALETDSTVAFVSHWFRTFGDEVWDWTPTACDLATLLDANSVNGAALVRRSAIEAVGGFDETMRDGCEDWDLWMSLVERGYPGKILPEILFYYRRRPDSMSRKMMEGDRHPRLFKRLVEKHRSSYQTHLTSVLTRRERDMSHLRQHIHTMELDYYENLAPELAKLQDDVSMLERSAETPRRPPGSAPRRPAPAHAAAVSRAYQLDALANRALADLDALRRSTSWRITAPLRKLYELFGGGRRPR